MRSETEFKTLASFLAWWFGKARARMRREDGFLFRHLAGLTR
jgi:hypothetical protein